MKSLKLLLRKLLTRRFLMKLQRRKMMFSFLLRSYSMTKVSASLLMMISLRKNLSLI